ncbi:hypothetical protein QYE76_008039 [Lolium multiflorum]|uniref:Uncharacterized protein n=1 Tax=Lolium multiflorum TaxID=4521 RepID=A0AAD8QER0_LOLMU|nr:hypothetical protein QYE76_008039 [Lolium multiflorum]
MENYSLLMGAAAVMKMAVEMAAVSMEKPSGALPRPTGAGTETPVPDLGFAMTAALELFSYRGFLLFERLGPLPPHNKRAESSQEEDFEESDGEEDRYHRPRWCPDGLSHSQKRRVQRLRNLEEAEAQYLYTLRRARPDLAVKIQQTLETKARPPKKVWRPKQAKADAQASADADAEASADTNMVSVTRTE